MGYIRFNMGCHSPSQLFWGSGVLFDALVVFLDTPPFFVGLEEEPLISPTKCLLD